MTCLWCERGLAAEEARRGNLCGRCQQISTGTPGLSRRQLDKLPFGVIELNRCGEILSFNDAETRLSRRAKDGVIGKNFFADIAPCADVKEFRGRFEGFLDGDSLSESFTYTYYFASEAVDVQITFLRINQQMAFVLSSRQPNA